MITLGLNTTKDSLRYCVLQGNKGAPVLIHTEELHTNNMPSVQLLMNWYETTFTNLINRFSPEVIGIKVTLKADRSQIAHWYYPLGILQNIAYQQNIETHEFTYLNFVASKFGLHKSIDIYNYIDQYFGEQNPRLDKNQKYAVLAAWMCLE